MEGSPSARALLEGADASTVAADFCIARAFFNRCYVPNLYAQWTAPAFFCETAHSFLREALGDLSNAVFFRCRSARCDGGATHQLQSCQAAARKARGRVVNMYLF